MRRWLRDRPWFWLMLLLAFLVAGGLVMVVVAELNRPQIVKDEQAQGPLTGSVRGGGAEGASDSDLTLCSDTCDMVGKLPAGGQSG